MNEQKDVCGFSWPDRNSIRDHVCIQRGLHEHHCGVCGSDVKPTAEQQGSDESGEGLRADERYRSLVGYLRHSLPAGQAVADLDGLLADRLAAMQAAGGKDVKRWFDKAVAEQARTLAAEAALAIARRDADELRGRLAAVEALDIAAVLEAHHWGDDTSMVGRVAMQCGCGWTASDAASRIYFVRARHDQHRATALRAALANPNAACHQCTETGSALVDCPDHSNPSAAQGEGEVGAS